MIPYNGQFEAVKPTRTKLHLFVIFGTDLLYFPHEEVLA